MTQLTLLLAARLWRQEGLLDSEDIKMARAALAPCWDSKVQSVPGTGTAGPFASPDHRNVSVTIPLFHGLD